MARDMACITIVPGKRGDSYRVQVWDPRAGKLHRKTFRVLAEARTWRDDVRIAVKHGTMRSASRTTVSEAAQALVGGMEAGTVLDRSGRPYKPATRRSYQQALRDYVVPDIGPRALSDVRRADVQDMVDRWRACGLSPSTIANKLDPLRVLYRRAVNRDEVTIDPTKLRGSSCRPSPASGTGSRTRRRPLP